MILRFTKWQEGSPNNTILGDPDCVAMNQVGTWIDIDCSKSVKNILSFKVVFSIQISLFLEKRKLMFVRTKEFGATANKQKLKSNSADMTASQNRYVL